MFNLSGIVSEHSLEMWPCSRDSEQEEMKKNLLTWSLHDLTLGTRYVPNHSTEHAGQQQALLRTAVSCSSAAWGLLQ